MTSLKTSTETNTTTTTLSNNSHIIVKQGFLTKLGGTGIVAKNWRRRLFILTENGDWTYLNEKEKIAGVIHLFSYNELDFASKETGKNYTFKIFNKSDPNVRPFYVFADSKEDMDSWVETISKLANIHVQGSAAPTPPPKEKEKEKEAPSDHDEFFVSKTRLNEMLSNIQRVERELEERKIQLEQEWRKVLQMREEAEQSKKDAQEEWQQAREARQKAKQVLDVANETAKKVQDTKNALETALKHLNQSKTSQTQENLK